ncbi:MAG: OsmC family protein [Saprospiraceae bacterium]|nr:OsmC family protein [Saprospiraceae bacterium]
MNTVRAAIHQNKYAVQISAGNNVLIADEPPEHGGGDTGFSPSELLAAALSACTSITLRMYADRKAWPLEAVQVEVTFERDEAGKNTTIVRKINLVGPLDETQKHRLMQIADKCPIHSILTHPIAIQSTLV